MQILEIVLYNRHGDTRRLSLEPGRLNVITGVSGTGKSAVLEIVHFCLGDDEDFRVPTGVISDLVAWYAIRVRTGGTELFIARPSPRLDDYASNAVALAIGERTPLPALDDLEPTTNVESLNGLLTRLLGIEENVQTPYRSARPELEANVRHALLYCFQRQYEIANPEFLFHRQTHGFIKMAIQDTLPFFVGAAERNQVEQQRRLRTLRRELRIARQRRDELLRTRTQALGRGAGIISEARNVGLADSEQAPETLDSVIDLLRAALDAPPAFPDLSPSAGRELARIEQRRLELTNEFRRVREEIDFVRLLTSEQDGYGGVVSEQCSRLTSVHAFAEGEQTCPVCEQRLQDATPTAEALNGLLQATSRKLEAHQRDLPRMQETLEQLEERELLLRTQLEDTQRALQALIAQRNEIERFRGLVNAQSYVRGRIAQYLEAVEEADDEAIASAELLVAELERRVAEAEERLGPQTVRDRLDSILGVIGQDMQRWAAELQLEHADSPLRIHPTELTVVADTRRGHIFLPEMGSGASWVGYHLVSHMALHKHFINEGRPVPRFVLLDQITQAFYPAEPVPDDPMTDLPDDDQSRVRAMFALLARVAEELAPHLQIIVMDHARISEPWFLQAVIADWHTGERLIPGSWIEEPEDLSSS